MSIIDRIISSLWRNLVTGLKTDQATLNFNICGKYHILLQIFPGESVPGDQLLQVLMLAHRLLAFADMHHANPASFDSFLMLDEFSDFMVGQFPEFTTTVVGALTIIGENDITIHQARLEHITIAMRQRSLSMVLLAEKFDEIFCSIPTDANTLLLFLA